MAVNLAFSEVTRIATWPGSYNLPSVIDQAGDEEQSEGTRKGLQNYYIDKIEYFKYFDILDAACIAILTTVLQY